MAVLSKLSLTEEDSLENTQEPNALQLSFSQGRNKSLIGFCKGVGVLFKHEQELFLP